MCFILNAVLVMIPRDFTIPVTRDILPPSLSNVEVRLREKSSAIVSRDSMDDATSTSSMMIEEKLLWLNKPISSLNSGHPDFPIRPRESSIKMMVLDGFLEERMRCSSLIMGQWFRTPAVFPPE